MVEAHGEEEAVRVDDLDLLPDPSPQRPGQVTGVTAFDDGAPALTPGKKRWQD